MLSIKSRRSFLSGLFLVFVSLMLFSGCAGGGTEVGNAGTFNFRGTTKLEKYLKGQIAKSVLPSEAYQVEENPVPPVIPVVEPPVTAPVTPDEDQETDLPDEDDIVPASSVSETDMVKTDGSHIYMAGNRKVTVADVSDGDNMKIEGSVEVGGTIKGLYVYNGLLSIIYSHDLPAVSDQDSALQTTSELAAPARIGMPYWIPANAKTGIAFYRVENPSSPELLGNISLDGNLVSARMVSGKLHIVQQYMPELPELETVYDGTEDGWVTAVNNNAEKIDSMTIDDILPDFTVCSADGTEIRSGRLVEPEDFYKLENIGGAAMVTVSTFDFDRLGDSFKSVGVIANADFVYASANALYIAASQWDYDKPYSENVLSATDSGIHKFDLSGTSVEYECGGTVKGRIINQFSMLEYLNVLRIATTDFIWNSDNSSGNGSSNIFCLKNIAGKLETIGKIENIAPGEKMYSARFTGNRGFLMTFRQVDTLFTIDLSDPVKPFIAGELEVPGYSEYIHPVDRNHLVTIGREVKEADGALVPGGLLLSIFDITDYDEPELLHTTVIGGKDTFSEASSDHNAFTFWSEKGLLAIPVTSGDVQAADGTSSFKGLYIYHVANESGFELKGRINTVPDVTSSSPGWTRGVFINREVFAVQPNAVFSADIDNIENSIKKISVE